MALLNIGDDPWLAEFESCQKLQRDIMEQLSIRATQQKSLDSFSRISAAIRIRLKQYNNEVSQLKQKLMVAFQTGAITYDEKERRTRQVELLQTKGIQMQKLFDDQTTTNKTKERSQLLASDWGSQDDELISVDPNQTSVEELRLQRSRMLEDQEKGLENLSAIISRQKNIAQTITTEVDLQNDIIDDLGEHIDRTDVRIKTETQNIGVIDRKDRTCIYWVIIIILFICIVTVACL